MMDNLGGAELHLAASFSTEKVDPDPAAVSLVLDRCEQRRQLIFPLVRIENVY